MATKEKKDIQSYNSSSDSLVKQLLVPSPVQIILYLLTSLLLLVVINIKDIWNYFMQTPAGQQDTVALFGDSQTTGILGSSTQGRIGQIILWGSVGIVIYIVIFFLKNILTNLRNDIVADEFVHPHSYSRARYWQSILLRKVFFILIVAVFITFIYLCFKMFPLLADTFFDAITNFASSEIITIILSVIASTLLLHVLVVLAHLTINSWRFIHTDL